MRGGGPRALEEVRRGLVEDRFEALLSLGQAGELVPALEAAVGEEPLRETALGAADARAVPSGPSGRRPPRLPAGPEALVDALGVEPGPELRELEAAILAQDDERLRSECGRRRPAGGAARRPRRRRWRAGRAPATNSTCSSARGGSCGRVGARTSPSSARGHRQDAAGGRAGGSGPPGRGRHLLRACDPDHRSARAVFDQALRSAGSSLDAGAGRRSDRRAAGGHRSPAGWASGPRPRRCCSCSTTSTRPRPRSLEVVADVAGSTRSVAALVVALFRTEPGEGGRRTGTAQQLVVGPARA